MTKVQKKDALLKALHTLGYNRIERLQAAHGNRIYLNGEYFGTFDFERGTFED